VESSKIIVVNGIAKAYGMTGFRIGWCIANRKLVEVMTNIQGQITSCTALVSQAAAEGALNGLQSVVEALRLSIENNREVMMTELGAFSGIRCTPPDGTFYCLPDFRAYSSNSVELANFLLRKARVVTVPGKDFGMEGYIRLSYAGSVKDVTEGIARIRWALDPNAPSEIYLGDRKLVRDWM
jgi:aspartate aminotransferase